jgi:hypothetical protein
MGYKYNPLILNGFDLSGGSGTSAIINPVATEAGLPPVPSFDGQLCVVLATDHIYAWDSTTSQWIDTGITSASAGSTPNSSGYSISLVDKGNNVTATRLILQPADASNPGLVSTSAQTFAGTKTFNAQITAETSVRVKEQGGGSDYVTIQAASQTASRTYTLPDAGEDASVVLTEGTQTINDIKTFSSQIYADGGLDVTSTGGSDTLSIGVSNADIINIGNPTATVNIVGSVNNNNVTTLNVADPLITINDGGGAGSAAGCGLEFEENATITGYIKTSADRNSIEFKSPNQTGIVSIDNLATDASVVLDAGNQTIQGIKTFSGTVNMSPLSASTPLKLDGSKNIISADIDLTADVSGILPIANGGTNSNTALNDNRVMKSSGGAIVEAAAITVNRALISDASGIPTQSVTTNTELSYVNGVTSAIQTQLDNKLDLFTGDIEHTSFTSIANNTATQTVTSFAFSNASVRAFEGIVSVYIDATTDLFAKFTLNGVQKSGSWEFSQQYVGDDITGLSFAVTTLGQVTVDLGNITGFSSGKVNFRALVTAV